MTGQPCTEKTINSTSKSASATISYVIGRAKAALFPSTCVVEDCNRALNEMARSLEDCLEPAEIQVALLRKACELSNAERVELWQESDSRPRPTASWPAPVGGTVQRAMAELTTSEWLRIPIRSGGQMRATLRLKPKPGAVWSPTVIAALTTMACMANQAETAIRNARLADIESTHDSISGLHNGTFVTAFLNYCTHQAQRRREAVTLLYLGLDRMEAIERLHGPTIKVAALRRVAKTILGTLRSSDLVGRVDDGRLVAILPNVAAPDGLNVAEALRTAVEESNGASQEMPALTISVGVATYPDHAHDVASLRSAAAGALMRAQAMGRNRVVGTNVSNPQMELSLVTAAG